ncbi:MAG: FAD/NAD(P)-binding oxidoreductase [Dehalococcoidia bacterium]
MAGSTTLILGGGVGGLVTANELRKRLGKEHRVVLVDNTGKHVFWPSLLWLQVGLREPEKITKDLALLERKDIEVVRGEVEEIDPQRRSVRVDGHQWEADYIVISLGAQSAPEKIPGLSEVGYNLYSLEGATAIRDARKGLTQGQLVVLITGVPFKCPAAPYEAAMLLDHDLRKRKLHGQVKVSVYSPEAGPMGVAGPEMSAGVRQMVEERGIDYFPQHQVTEVDPSAHILHFANGSSASFDFLVWVPPHVAPQVVQRAGLTGETGWIAVDRHTMETRFPGVYAIGDVTGIPLSVGLPLPKAGVFAHHQAEVVAQNIAVALRGKGKTATFNGHGECFVEVGSGKAGFGRGNFYAEPRPTVKLHKPGRHWHAAKVLFEKDWLRRWF